MSQSPRSIVIPTSTASSGSSFHIPTVWGKGVAQVVLSSPSQLKPTPSSFRFPDPVEKCDHLPCPSCYSLSITSSIPGPIQSLLLAQALQPRQQPGESLLHPLQFNHILHVGDHQAGGGNCPLTPTTPYQALPKHWHPCPDRAVLAPPTTDDLCWQRQTLPTGTGCSRIKPHISKPGDLHDILL